MKRKSYLLILLSGHLLAADASRAQVHVTGQLSVQSGAVMRIGGDLSAAQDISGAGTVLLGTTAGQQILDMNGHALPAVEIANPDHVMLRTGARIRERIVLTSGSLLLDDHDLILEKSAVAVRSGQGGQLVTSGTGMVVAEQLSRGDTCALPLGISAAAGGFAPVRVTNRGTDDDIRVRVTDDARSGATVHNPASGVDRCWQVISGNGGEWAIELGHQTTSEGGAFDRSRAFVTRQLTAGGQIWSTAPGSAGRGGGLLHEGVFLLPASDTVTAWFSKSSDSTYSLGSVAAATPYLDAAETEVSFLPNPFRTDAGIRIRSPRAGMEDVLLLDAAGRVVRSMKLPLVAGVAAYNFSGAALPAGVYLLHFSGMGNVIRIVKQ